MPRHFRGALRIMGVALPLLEASVPVPDNIYLFRHAAYREVAYHLQLPSERSNLHAGTLDIVEKLFPDEVEPLAAELAEHARLARESATGDEHAALAEKEIRYMGLALTRAVGRAQWDGVLAVARAMLQCPGLDSEGRLKAQRHVAEACFLMGPPEAAAEEFGTLIELAREIGDYKSEVSGVKGRATALSHMGRHDEANALLDELIALADQRGDGETRALALMTKALDASGRGDYATTMEYLHQAEDAVAEKPDASIRLMIKGNLANHLGNLGDREESIRVQEKLAQEFERTGDVRSEGISRANLGRQRLLSGDLRKAESDFNRAIEGCTELGNRRTEAFARANLAELEMRLGRFESAAGQIWRATEIAQDLGLRVYLAAYLVNEARLELLLGHHRRASELVENARAEFIGVGSEAFVPEYCGIARLRIAAAEAVATPPPGRDTARVRAHPPHPGWLRVLRGMLKELETARDSRGLHVHSLLHMGICEGNALLEELESAVAEDRPAVVFRGHRPAEMLPELKASLLKRLREETPAELEFIRRNHPALLEALGGE